MILDPETKLRALFEISRSLSERLDLQRLIPFIVSKTKELLDAESSAVMLLSEDHRELYIPYTADVAPEIDRRLTSVRFPADRGIAGWVVEHGEAQLVPDVTKDPRWYPGVDQKTGMTTMSLICVPLKTRHGAIGVISLRNKQGAVFTEADLELLDALAGSIATAIENALLYARLKDSETQLRLDVDRLHREMAERQRAEAALQEEAAISLALARVGSELISSLDTPVILDRLCQLTAEVLECDRSHTLLWQKADRAYAIVAGSGTTAEEREVAHLLRVPPEPLEAIVEKLKDEDATEFVLPPEILNEDEFRRFGIGCHLVIALRRGIDLIGLQFVNRRCMETPYSPRQLRVARGIAQLASMALNNAQLVEELDRANRLKSDFVATMSHELRTPLHIMMGYNTLLVEEQFGSVNNEQSEALKRIDKSARDLLSMVNATLDLGRIEAGQMPVDIEEVQLSKLLATVREELNELQSKDGLTFEWRITEELPSIRTDATKLKVIIKNLIDNAVKFTEHGTIRISAQPEGEGILLEVTDTGIGIAPEIMPGIFDSFRQGDSAFTRRYGGVGLGLYIVRRLLDLLGGSVEVESKVGTGSTFKVHLPPIQGSNWRF